MLVVCRMVVVVVGCDDIGGWWADDGGGGIDDGFMSLMYVLMLTVQIYSISFSSTGKCRNCY